MILWVDSLPLLVHSPDGKSIHHATMHIWCLGKICATFNFKDICFVLLFYFILLSPTNGDKITIYREGLKYIYYSLQKRLQNNTQTLKIVTWKFAKLKRLHMKDGKHLILKTRNFYCCRISYNPKVTVFKPSTKVMFFLKKERF